MPSGGDVRAVVDTNVLLSALFWRGTPHSLIEQVRAGTLTLISSPSLLAELVEIMNRPKFQPLLVRSKTDPERVHRELWRLDEIIDPPLPSAPVSRDLSDDAVLALAAASQADLIITGDADLLELGSYADIATSSGPKPKRSSGLAAKAVQSRATGSFEFEAASGIYNELQCGSDIHLYGNRLRQEPQPRRRPFRDLWA